ncbi:heme NO-binding domain-containing protein [Allorhizobium undicola]|uniref:heme NO-binding domain-containing protein n=1 Tax=Allorhizobium undicola TaxID=78527 RepID=UPI000563CDDB|nr:heme NO-binding domain-containing protein [Allorhizobium undicola]
MKGIVFTEFLQFVGDMWNEDLADDLIEASDLPSGGAYTSVGTYDHAEMVRLVSELSARTERSPQDLLFCFGQHLAGRFATLFPAFFAGAGGLFDFLESVDNHIHVEVLKLYPDAELPRFTTLERTGDVLTLRYTSARHMEDLAVGLIHGAAAHFGKPVSVTVIAEDAQSSTLSVKMVG